MSKMKNQVVSGMIWKFGERIIAQGVSLTVSAILARILLVEDYAPVAVVMIFMALANVFLNSGLNVALIQKKNVTETDYSTIFWFNLALSIVLYIILFFASPLIAIIYKQEILVPIIRVYALALPISAFQTVQVAYISKRMEFKKFFFSTIGGTLVSAVVGITMALSGCGVWSLVAQYLTNVVIDTTVLALIVRWRPKFVFSKESARPMIKFGYKVTLTDTIGTLFNNLVQFLMGVKYTASDLSYYSKGVELPRLLRDNIFATVISVLFPAMSNISDDKENVKRLARKAISITTYLIYPMMFGIFAVNTTLVEVVLTAKWLGMSPYIAISCLEAVISVASTIGFQAIKSLGRSDILLKNEFLTKPVFLVFIVGGLLISPLAMAIALLVASVYCTAVAHFFMKKIICYPFNEQFRDICGPMLMSLIMCLVVSSIGFIDMNRIVCLILQIVCGVLVYLFLSMITKNSSYLTLKDLVMEKLNRKKVA